MELLSKTSENKFVILLLHNKKYASILQKVINLAKKDGGNVCYVCLSKPYHDVIEDLESERIDCGNFIFIDTLSSFQYRLKPVKNCIFVSGPEKLNDIRKAVKKAVQKHNCEAIIFDTISTLMIYKQTHS